MLGKIFLVVSLFSLLLYMYGILTTIVDVEEQNCKMTFMYEFPNFVRIDFEQNDRFPKYALYAYAEGHLTEAARNMHFHGAPVLFIPGNSGSFKQARSLASVALRKGLDNDWTPHLDYFTVSLNGEYSGLFGGVLEEQTEFIGLAIKKILLLYARLPRAPKSLVIIGHSMGGKIAQALATNSKVSPAINTIITLAAPMQRPVAVLDQFFAQYYDRVDGYWKEHRPDVPEVTNTTNFCRQYRLARVENETKDLDEVVEEETRRLSDKLLITIGGGSRDVMVHPGLTDSPFSDIHAMATKIPRVWCTTDHLSSVWCLQLVIAINRFLYGIVQPLGHKKDYYKGTNFIRDKEIRLAKARKLFAPTEINATQPEVSIVSASAADPGDWIEDSRRVFSEEFKKGLNRTRVQMIRLFDSPLHKFLKVEAINLETSDWVFGCAALELRRGMRFCSRAVSLSQYASVFPSLRYERHLLMMDLHEIRLKNPTWTHILLRIQPTDEPLRLNVDIHNPGDREIAVLMPKWYSYGAMPLLDDTVIGASLYTLKISEMAEPFQTLELQVTPRSCQKNGHHSVARLCVPWTDGFDRYHYFTELKRRPMYIYVPRSKPSSFNTTITPVSVELHLDPNCRYRVVVRNSLGMTAGRIAQQYSHWLPAHLVAILLLAFKHQLSVTPKNEPFKAGALLGALTHCTPFFIITASRVFAKIVLWFRFLAEPDSYDAPLLASVLIHGSGVALLSLATPAAWGAVCFCGNAAHRILVRLIRFPIPTISSTVVAVIEKFPLSAGVFLISVSCASCGCVGLICACLVHFILLVKMYEDYLEEFVFKTAKLIAEKLFGKKPRNEDGDPAQPPDAAGGDNNDENQEEGNIEQPADAIEVNRRPAPAASNESEQENEEEIDTELDEMLRQSIEQHRLHEERRKEEEKKTRVEYDSVADGLSAINFHLALFFLLLIVTALNLPAVITWAKNYHYSAVLNPDPSLVPAIFILAALCIIWQLSTPRIVIFYNILTSILYVLAVCSILYCQEEVYRLNYLVALTFIVVAVHQVAAPKFVKKPKIDLLNDPRFRLDLLPERGGRMPRQPPAAAAAAAQVIQPEE